MKHLTLIVVLSFAAASASACVGYERKSTDSGPSATGVNAMLGSWSSANIIPSPSTCTNFRWNATEQTATSARGSFSATCAGDLQVSGTAQGTLNTSSSTINWQATGTASGPGLTGCEIALSGTAELGVDSIRIPYSGKTCLGAVAGVEILQK
jgi:hypothetical protein